MSKRLANPEWFASQPSLIANDSRGALQSRANITIMTPVFSMQSGFWNNRCNFSPLSPHCWLWNPSRQPSCHCLMRPRPKGAGCFASSFSTKGWSRNTVKAGVYISSEHKKYTRLIWVRANLVLWLCWRMKYLSSLLLSIYKQGNIQVMISSANQLATVCQTYCYWWGILDNCIFCH